MSESSPFDKNLRSLMEAIAMFEREAGLLLDRFGVDRDTVGRVFDLFGSVSADAVRPLASALGIADAAAVESLSRDIRALLQGEARLRREQASSAVRLDELVAAIEALGNTTATLADLQARTQERLDGLAGRAESAVEVDEQRERILEDVERLRTRIDELERRLASEMGMAMPGVESPGANAAPVKAVRRPMPRTVNPTGSAKILEGLPTLEPKVRPA